MKLTLRSPVQDQREEEAHPTGKVFIPRSVSLEAGSVHGDRKCLHICVSLESSTDALIVAQFEWFGGRVYDMMQRCLHDSNCKGGKNLVEHFRAQALLIVDGVTFLSRLH
jgi:hypothetical protein